MDRQPGKKTSYPDDKGNRHSIEIVVGKEEDILWTPANEFLKSECEKEPQSPQTRVSSIINGCINTLSSLVPICVRKSPGRLGLQANRCRGNWCSPSSKQIVSIENEVSNKNSRIDLKSTPSNFIGIPNDPRMESISSYSFEVPSFEMGDTVNSAEDLRSLVNSVRSVLSSHLEKAGMLLESEKNLPDEVSEIVRVAFGHTDLLLRKRISQFSKQLESYSMPAADAKLTTLNDLIGLWSLVESQLVDISKCFKEVEKCRLAGWKVPNMDKA